MKTFTILFILVLISACFYIVCDAKRTKKPRKGKRGKTTPVQQQTTTVPTDVTQAMTTTVAPSETSPNSNPTAAATTTLPSNSPATNGPGDSQPPPPIDVGSGGGTCSSANCNFEQGNPCTYQSAEGKQWEVIQGKYKNLGTGIRKADEGTYYIATYLKPNETATLSTSTSFDNDQEVKFLMYRMTDRIVLTGCCDDNSHCSYTSEKKVNAADFNHWKPASVKCPKGTKKVLFRASNAGGNEGAVGLDDIKVAC